MRVLPSKLKRVYCDVANFRAGIEWYNILGNLVCSRKFTLLECYPSTIYGNPIHTKYKSRHTRAPILNDPLKPYLNTFYWQQDIARLTADWLNSEFAATPAARHLPKYDKDLFLEVMETQRATWLDLSAKRRRTK